MIELKTFLRATKIQIYYNQMLNDANNQADIF